VQNAFRRLAVFLFIAGTSVTGTVGGSEYFTGYPGDRIIEKFEPPSRYYQIREGSCGEACLWSVLRNRNIRVSQEAINRTGGNPGRGLHSGELFTVLKRYRIRYRKIPGRVTSYQHYLEKRILAALVKGSPLLIGVKIYPDVNPQWACDHFILAVGYNKKRQELIYNSFNRRYRIKYTKLLNREKGYSLVSKQNYVFAIAF
jgi:hypothetical protein